MRRPIKKREKVGPDARYQSAKVAQFINYIMYDGKKDAARKNVYKAFDAIKENTKKDPVEVFEQALENVGPTVEVRSRRVGGANYQVPHEVRPERRLSLAMRWIKDITRSKKGVKTWSSLADELIAAANNEGEAVRKRENVHKMAEANRAFAHFAWTSKKK